MALIPLGLLGAAAGFGLGLAGESKRQKLRAQQQQFEQEEYTRRLIIKDALERAQKGDSSIVESPAFAESVGNPQIAQLITGTLANTLRGQAQQQQTNRAQAGAFFGEDAVPLTQTSTTVAVEPPTGQPAPRPPAGDRPIDMNRPVLPGQTPGTSATEETITVEMDGRHYLIPTIVNGQRVPPEQAVQMFRGGQNPDVGEYGSAEEAERAAVARSQRIGKTRGLGDEPSEPPLTPFQRLQESLTEGQSVSGEVGGLKFTATGNTKARMRKLIQQGVRMGMSYDDLVLGISEQTGDLSQLEGLTKYGDAQFMRAYREELARQAKEPLSPNVADRKRAAFTAALRIGRVPDAFKEQVNLTREDESAAAYDVVTGAMRDKGLSFMQARQMAEAKGIKLSREDDVVLGQRYYGEVLTELKRILGESVNPEVIMSMAAQAVGNDPRLVPREDREAATKVAPMDPKTAARITEQGGRVPRMGDVGRAGGVAGARQAVEADEITEAGKRAGTVKSAQEAVPERPSVSERSAAQREQASFDLAKQIEADYGTLASQFGGPFGLKGRITALRAKANQPQAQAAADLSSNLQLLRAEYIHALSGAQIGPSDQTVYLRRVPDLDRDSDVEFKANMKAMLAHMKRLNAARASIEGAANLKPTGGTPKAGPKEIGAREDALRKKYGLGAPAAPGAR